MDGWNLAVLAATGYFAVMILVRLMARRRDGLLAGPQERGNDAIDGGGDTAS